MKLTAKLIIQLFLNRFRSNQGTSVVEILVTLVLLSLIMTGLFLLGSSLLPVLQEERGQLISIRNDCLIHRVLEREFNQLSPPWWLGDYEITQEKNRWVFPWYGGSQEAVLELSQEKDALIIKSTAALFLVFQETGPLEFSLLAASNGAPALVKAEGRVFSSGTAYFALGSRVTPGTDLP